MLLRCTNVSKMYGARVILKQVTAHIAPQSITLVVGANGAGKSTLLRLMAGLSRPTAGEIVCMVDDAQVGYVGHATFLYPALTAWENLDFWAQMYAVPSILGISDRAASIDAVLHRVRLHAHANERAGVFSRGMAQRLNLARVLLLQPQLLLLDEPSTGLDAPSAALLRQEICAAKERGASVVWISHDIAGDSHFADTVLALHSGTVMYHGAAKDYTC